MTGVISGELELAYGRNIIDFINGVVTNETVSPPTVSKFDDYGAKKYMQKIRALFMYVESDVHATFAGADLEFDMMSFNKIMRNIDIETLTIEIDTQWVPNKVKVIFVASDNPYFEFDTSNNRPHMFYTNQVTAIAASYTNLFYRHTLGAKNKIKIFNGAVNINLDIQHRETPESDTNENWVSYDGFPRVVNAGDTYVFGDDALRDTTHHFHRVRVQSTGADVAVKGAYLNI